MYAYIFVLKVIYPRNLHFFLDKVSPNGRLQFFCNNRINLNTSRNKECQKQRYFVQYPLNLSKRCDLFFPLKSQLTHWKVLNDGEKKKVVKVSQVSF